MPTPAVESRSPAAPRAANDSISRAAVRLHETFPPMEPVRVATLVAVYGWALLTLALLGIGLVLTQLLLDGPIGRADQSIAEWFESVRTSGWNAVSDYGSKLSDTPTVLLVSAVVLGVLWWRGLWRDIALIGGALTMELSSFLVVTFAIDRPRPDVRMLDIAPPTSSYPSGHVAAAIALYATLAIVATRHADARSIRVVVWIAVVCVVASVTTSRLYRGMHHLTDATVGLAAGVAFVLVAVIAVRTYDARERDEVRAADTPVPERST